MRFLGQKYGICGEVCLTAYAVYVQIVEGLTTTDDLYHPDKVAIDWFAGKGFQYQGTNRQPERAEATL